MIKEVTYYDIICDRCGKSLIYESETCYPDTGSAEMTAKDREWLVRGSKHYCHDCRKSFWNRITNLYSSLSGLLIILANCAVMVRVWEITSN